MADTKGETVKKWSKIGYFWGPQILRIFVNVNTDCLRFEKSGRLGTLRGVLITTGLCCVFDVLVDHFGPVRAIDSVLSIFNFQNLSGVGRRVSSMSNSIFDPGRLVAVL